MPLNLRITLLALIAVRGEPNYPNLKLEVLRNVELVPERGPFCGATLFFQSVPLASWLSVARLDLGAFYPGVHKTLYLHLTIVCRTLPGVNKSKVRRSNFADRMFLDVAENRRILVHRMFVESARVREVPP